MHKFIVELVGKARVASTNTSTNTFSVVVSSEAKGSNWLLL